MSLHRNPAIWALFDPKVYPDGPPPGLWTDDSQDPPSEPDIPLAQGLKTRITKRSRSGSKPTKNAHHPSAAALEAAAQKFPDLVPPSAESLTADAPPEVLEAELKRLLGDWNRGLDVLEDLVNNMDENIRGVGSNGTFGGTQAAGGHGRATKKRGYGYGNGNGREHSHGRARGTGEGMEDLSLSANDDFDLYPPADSTSSAGAIADENSDSTQVAAAAAAAAPPPPAPPAAATTSASEEEIK